MKKIKTESSRKKFAQILGRTTLETSKVVLQHGYKKVIVYEGRPSA
jgi:hypothetical protein